MGRALTVALLCGLVACEDSGGDGGGATKPPVSTGERQHSTNGQSWTVLVYMVADNNLEGEALDDIVEMADVGSGPGVNIVAQVDRAVGFSEDGLGTVGNWTTTKRLLVQPGALQELVDLGETNSGDAATLADFITWGVSTFPADRYALILWDHGGAWVGYGVDEDAPGAPNSTDRLDLNELKAGIAEGMRGAGLDQFALLGFDACLMATYEVARALGPQGEYLLASEALEPGHGWNYGALAVLRQDPTTTPLVLGQQLIQGYSQQARAAGTEETITLSLTDLYALDDLSAAVQQLAAVYPTTDGALATAIGRGRGDSLEFGRSPDPAQSFYMFDLGSLSQQVATQAPQAGTVSTAMQAALAKAVVAKTSGASTTAATGLAIYFPPSASYYNPAYDALTEVANWREFLGRYLQGGGVQVSPAFTSEQADAQLSPDGLTLTGQLAPGSGQYVTQASFYQGYVLADGRLVALGDRPAQLSGDAVQGTWDLSVLLLEQGTKSGFGYLSLSLTTSGDVLAVIPFQYVQGPGMPPQSALRALVVDASGNVTQDTYYVETNDVLSALTPVPGSVLLPLVAVYDPATDTTSFQVVSAGQAGFDATQPIGLRFDTLASGTAVFGILQVQDYSGATSQAYNVVSVP